MKIFKFVAAVAMAAGISGGTQPADARALAPAYAGVASPYSEITRYKNDTAMVWLQCNGGLSDLGKEHYYLINLPIDSATSLAPKTFQLQVPGTAQTRSTGQVRTTTFNSDGTYSAGSQYDSVFDGKFHVSTFVAVPTGGTATLVFTSVCLGGPSGTNVAISSVGYTP